MIKENIIMKDIKAKGIKYLIIIIINIINIALAFDFWNKFKYKTFFSGLIF